VSWHGLPEGVGQEAPPASLTPSIEGEVEGGNHRVRSAVAGGIAAARGRATDGTDQDRARSSDASPFAVRFTQWDFASKPSPPQWQWHGVLEESTITLLSGRWSAAKSLLTAGLVTATVQGREFLGRGVKQGPVLMLDAENPPATTLGRLQSLGVTNADRENVRHVGRDAAPALGSPQWDVWLDWQVEEFEPALITVDGSVSSTVVNDPSDVEGIKRFYKSLRYTLQGRPTAVLVLHHERKPQDGRRGDAGYAAIGSVYWQNLADSSYALARAASDSEDTDTGSQLRTQVQWEVTKPPRNAVVPDLGHVALTGTFDPDGALLSTVIEPADDPGVQQLVQALLLHGAPMPAGELAQAVGMDADGGAFHAVRRAALEAGAILQDEPRKPYFLPEMEP
jgi:hypothetical protein